MSAKVDGLNILKLFENPDLEIPGRVIYATIYGSKLYGTSSGKSDLDIRGIFIPDIILLSQGIYNDEFNWSSNKDGRNTETDIDIKLFSIQKFIKLCSNGDTNALDVLFAFGSGFGELADDSCRNIMQSIYDNRSELINTSDLHVFLRYAMSQAQKYGIRGQRLNTIKTVLEYLEKLPAITYDDLPLSTRVGTILHCWKDETYLFKKRIKQEEEDDNAPENDFNTYLNIAGGLHQYATKIKEVKRRLTNQLKQFGERSKEAAKADGKDCKALSHAVRCLMEFIELQETGNIKFPLDYADFIKDIKNDKFTYEQVKEIFEEYLVKAEQLQKENPLGWHLNKSFMYGLCNRIYRATSASNSMIINPFNLGDKLTFEKLLEESNAVDASHI